MTICNWCRAPLTFSTEKGWVHADGQMYVSHHEQRPCVRCGGRFSYGAGQDRAGRGCERCGDSGYVSVTVDDHCAMPVLSGAAATPHEEPRT